RQPNERAHGRTPWRELPLALAPATRASRRTPSALGPAALVRMDAPLAARGSPLWFGGSLRGAARRRVPSFRVTPNPYDPADSRRGEPAPPPLHAARRRRTRVPPATHRRDPGGAQLRARRRPAWCLEGRGLLLRARRGADRAGPGARGAARDRPRRHRTRR